MQSAKLIVLEGPDGAGKSTVAIELVKRLKKEGIDAINLAFPGNSEGSLGELVYRLHHDSKSVGVNSISPAAIQALHVAAHLDAIEDVIKPSINSGSTVVLDRYWWSTVVYGQFNGVNNEIISKLINIEKLYFDPLRPDYVFLLKREDTSNCVASADRNTLSSLYSRFIEDETFNYPVHEVSNNQSIQQTVEDIWLIISKNLAN